MNTIEKFETTLDADGNCVIFGLSLEETSEMLRLEHAISNSVRVLQRRDGTSISAEQKRWLQLYDKYETALPGSQD
jgi:hypothetical protein